MLAALSPRGYHEEVRLALCRKFTNGLYWLPKSIDKARKEERRRLRSRERGLVKFCHALRLFLEFSNKTSIVLTGQRASLQGTCLNVSWVYVVFFSFFWRMRWVLHLSCFDYSFVWLRFEFITSKISFFVIKVVLFDLQGCVLKKSCIWRRSFYFCHVKVFEFKQQTSHLKQCWTKVNFKWFNSAFSLLLWKSLILPQLHAFRKLRQAFLGMISVSSTTGGLEKPSFDGIGAMVSFGLSCGF